MGALARTTLPAGGSAAGVMNVTVICPIWPGHTGRTEWAASRCTADLFDPNFLTITSDSGMVLKVFPPEAWIRVSVRGDDGYEVFAFDNTALSAQPPSVDADARRI